MSCLICCCAFSPHIQHHLLAVPLKECVFVLVTPYVQLQLFETPWTIAHQSLLSLEFIYICVYIYILGLRASQVVLVVKNLPANAGDKT